LVKKYERVYRIYETGFPPCISLNYAPACTHRHTQRGAKRYNIGKTTGNAGGRGGFLFSRVSVLVCFFSLGYT